MLTVVQINAVLFAVLCTSILSGVFGMAGGLILMGVLASLLPVPLAMATHGFAQLIANGTRALTLRRSILWRACVWFFFGSALAAACFWSVLFTPSRALLFLTLGAIPFVTFLPWTPALDFQKPHHAFICGVVVTISHLTAGVSGPILDLFFVRSEMNRFQMIGTKAFTQTFGHALKIIYFGAVFSTSRSLPAEFLVGIAIAAILGTFLGGSILRRLSEVDFRYYLRRLFVIIGCAYLLRGIWELL